LAAYKFSKLISFQEKSTENFQNYCHWQKQLSALITRKNCSHTELLALIFHPCNLQINELLFESNLSSFD
jgi:hypothetical protein